MVAPLKALGMDLYANYYAAAQILLHHSSRFMNLSDPHVPPFYSWWYTDPHVAGITDAYGNLTIILMLLFLKIPFTHLYAYWFCISLGIIWFLIAKIFLLNKDLGSNFKIFAIPLCCIIITALSGPINFLLERGQLEIVIPLLLYFVWQDFSQKKEGYFTALLLGLAIHIKIWPLTLSLIFLRDKKYLLFLTSIIVPVLLNVLFIKWLPIHEYLAAIHSYTTESPLMVGWFGISLYSLIGTIWTHVPWYFISYSFYLLMSMLGLYFVFFIKTQDETNYRGLLFTFFILYSLLAPGYMCDYALIIGLLLLIILIETYPSYSCAIFLAILLSNLLFFQNFSGAIKAGVLLSFTFVIIKAIFDLPTKTILEKTTQC